MVLFSVHCNFTLKNFLNDGCVLWVGVFQEPVIFRLEMCIHLELKSPGMVYSHGCDQDCNWSGMKCTGNRHRQQKCFHRDVGAGICVFSVCSRIPVFMAKTNYIVIEYCN